MIVDDIDEMVGELRRLDLGADLEPVRNDRVDTVMIKDPDCNSIAFAAPKDQSLAH